MLTGGIPGLLVACTVRFLVLALGPVESRLEAPGPRATVRRPVGARVRRPSGATHDA